MKLKNKSKPEKEEPRVIFYSGYKSEETPRSLIIKGKKLVIKKVIKRQRFMDQRSGKRTNRFICRTECKTYLIQGPEGGPYRIKVYVK